MATPRTLTDAQVRTLYAKALGPVADARLSKWAEGECPSPQLHRTLIVPTAATWLALDCGVRLSELAGIMWADLEVRDVDAATVIVETRKQLSKARRTLPLPGDLAAWLAKLAAVRGRYAGETNKYVMGPFRARAPVHTRSLARGIGKICEEALGIKVNPHMLRHTFASDLVQRTDLESLRHLMGHRSLKSTQVYLHVNPKRMRDAVAARAAERAAEGPSDID